MKLAWHPLPAWRRALRLASALAAAALTVVACGGGGSVAGVGTGGTGSFASGPITGFGSVIVGGIRYDDQQAQVLGEDGAPASRADLRLGMVIDIQGSALSPAPAGSSYTRVGQASGIRFDTVVVGPLTAVDASARSATVHGQQVVVTARTVFSQELTGGLSALQAALSSGAELAVYGFVDRSGGATGRLTATRIERRDDPSHYRVVGVVRDLDRSAQTFRIGDLLLSYAGLATLFNEAGHDNGSLLRLRTGTTPQSGAYVIDRLDAVQRRLADRDEAEIEGRITRFVSVADFDVEGLPVDASAARFDDGSPADLALGARVEIEGAIRDGVLVAREVEIEDDNDASASLISLEGVIQNLNTTARTFDLQGLQVRYTDDTRYDDGTADDLANGARIELDARLDADGSTLIAIEIEFDD